MASRFPRPTQVQSLLMPRSRFRTPAAACGWAVAHDFKCPEKIDTTARFHRLRQAAPVACTGGTLRTIPFGKSGIKAVICSPKRGAKRAFQGLDAAPIGGNEYRTVPGRFLTMADLRANLRPGDLVSVRAGTAATGDEGTFGLWTWTGRTLEAHDASRVRPGTPWGTAHPGYRILYVRLIGSGAILAARRH